MRPKFFFALVFMFTVPAVIALAALSDPVSPTRPAGAPSTITYTRPVSTMTDWVMVCDDPATADNAGSTVVNPGGITRSAQRKCKMIGSGTTAAIRLRYPTAGTVTTAPVVQVFGFDSAGIPERLVDATASHALTLTVDTANDARDGTYSYTQPVEVDVNACTEFLVAVKTALGGSSLTNATIVVRIK